MTSHQGREKKASRKKRRRNKCTNITGKLRNGERTGDLLEQINRKRKKKKELSLSDQIGFENFTVVTLLPEF